MGADLIHVIEQIGREKGIEREVLIEAVGAAIISASRKALGSSLDLQIDFDDRLGRFQLYSVKKVVENVTNPKLEISLEEAAKVNREARLGDEVKILIPMEAQGFGRIAAQTAKQVIIQRVREAERDSLYQNYKNREGELISGIVHRVSKGSVIIDLGKAEALLPAREQLPQEELRPGDRVRAYILEVRKTTKGSQIVLSRTHPGFLIRLFELEVPEIYEGIVQIKAAAREPGERAKVAVLSKDPNVDPVGACVGYRGSRVQAVVKELQGERIDIIPWKEGPADFVRSALAPAEVDKVTVDPDSRILKVIVADDQLSLAIGRRGVNARLAAKLVGWKVDIRSKSELAQEAARMLQPGPGIAEAIMVEETPMAEAAVVAESPLLTHLPGVGLKTTVRLADAGFDTVAKIAASSLEELLAVKGIGAKTAERLITAAQEALLSGDRP